MARQVVVAAIGRRTTYDLNEATLSDALLKAQRTCAFTQAKKAAMSREHEASEPTTWQIDPKGLLRKNDQIYIPVGSALRGEILACYHDNPLGGHFGIRKTTELVGRLFFWPGMRTEIAEYVESCTICQRNKAKRHRPYSVLTLKEQVFDAILVMVDKYTKAIRYLPARKDWNAEDLAEAFLKE
ncbi:hypothetical protein DV738_g5684, partial [Chaetothyriales sp. CBS 135597]